MRKASLLLVFPALLLLETSSLVRAQEGSTRSDSPSRPAARMLEVHGFLLGIVSGRTSGLRPKEESSDFVLGEERLRLDVSGESPSGEAGVLAKGDVFHDALEGEVDVDLREAQVNYAYGPLDFRFGRQIATWGIGDLFFIGDVFPKDWESFFSGRPIEYLKLGVDGLRARYSAASINAEALAVPFFTADRLPPADRFFFFDPFSVVTSQQEEKPNRRFSNTELALRLYRQLAGLEASVILYRGFWRMPAARADDTTAPTNVTRFFPRLSVYAASVQRSFLGGVLGCEAGYYDSRQDRVGKDPAIPNSQWRFLAADQRQPWEDFTVVTQLYGEVMNHYGSYSASRPPQSPRDDRLRSVVSARLTQLLDYQTWKLGLFAAYSPTDDDYFLQPEASRRVTDEIGVSLGANLFGGRSSKTFFGQFEKSDNMFVSVRFDF